MEELQSYNDQELLDRWDVERSMAVRDELFAEIKRRRLYPSDAVNTWEVEAGLYPETDDPRFIEKLMSKQEFAENLQESLLNQKKRGVNPCDSQEEFELTPVQRFVSRFLSPSCPYVSALLYHGVGVGKTCAAITTAEEYLRAYPSEPVFIVAPRNIQPGFRRTIFDEESLVIGTEDGVANEHKGCTGNSYLKRAGVEFERDKDTIVRRVNQAIKSRYVILGYIQFYRYIQNILDRVPKGLDEERTKQEKIRLLRREFSGRMVIVDEAHNLRDAPGETDDDDVDVAGGEIEMSESKAGKRLTPALLEVIGAAEGMKLLLMSGTPMYNSYREIVFLLRLLLLNDKKAPITEKEIFTPTGAWRPGGREKLGAAASAYVSFMRGENPLSFPVRLEPEKVPMLEDWPTESPAGEEVFKEGDRQAEKVGRILMKLPFVPVSYEGASLKQIRSIADASVELGGLGVRSIDEMVQSGNWFFPGSDEGAEPEMRIRDTGFDNAFDEVKTGTLSQFAAKDGAGRWLAKAALREVSPKAHFILNRIPASKGVIFVYSRFIKSGALPLAIALEANGYTPYGRDRPLFTNGVVDGLGRQCALCELREKGHAGKGHKFTPAKYVLLTGQAVYSPNNPAAIKAARSANNINGQDVKVVIGSQVASEGIDLRFIREIYVFDSWFHLNKMEQVLGRGVRTCSHSLLPEAQRNCTIYLLVNTYEGDAQETADLYMYRNATNKALQIGQVTRALKEYALDCNLNHRAIFIKDLPPIEYMEDAQGNPRPNISINDTPFTSICDWMECPYACAKPVDVGKVISEGLVDASTYDEYAMRWRESQIKKILKALFEQEENPMIQIDSLVEALRTAEIPELAIRTVLSEIVGQPSFRLKIGGQEGYIIYRNTYYLFQPIRLADVRIPLALRIADVPVRKDEYEAVKITYTTEKTSAVAPQPVAAAAAAEGAPAAAPAAPAPAAASEGTAAPYWTAITAWATAIRAGTSDLDIPDDVQTTMEKRYTGDEYKREYNILTMVSWMVEYVQRSPEVPEARRAPFLAALADTLLELVWDESLRAKEQFELIGTARDAVIEAVAGEQLLKRGTTEVFRFVNPTTGAVEYLCGSTKCSEAVVRLFDTDATNPINRLEANRNTTGRIYGFIIPKTKDGRLVFKTNDRPVDPGVAPEKGGECEIVSSIENHKKLLREMRSLITELGYPVFLLSDAVLDEKGERKKEAAAVKKKKKAGEEEELTAAQKEFLKTKTRLRADSRKFQNVQKACALKDIMLRLLDKLERAAGRKRYFYRPVAAIKSKHRLK